MSPELVRMLGVCLVVLLAWCCVMFCVALTFGWFEDDWIEVHDSKDGPRW